MRDHAQLSRVFTRATERYMRRREAYHYHMLCGQDGTREQELARQAVALVARLGALHPMMPIVDGLQGPLHRPDE